MAAPTSKLDTHSDGFRQNRADMLAKLAGVRELEQKVRDTSNAKADVFRKRGQVPPRERIDRLLDKGSPFLELQTLAGLGFHDDDGKDNIMGGGTIIGIGYVEGVRCLINASDSGIKGGTIAPLGSKKSLRGQDISIVNKLPRISLIESGGANLKYQADLFVEGGRGFYNQAKLSAAGIPQIAVVHGSSTAGGAYVPGMSDYTIMVKGGAKVFLAGPPLLFAATGEVATDEELGGAEMHTLVSGVSEFMAEDDADGIRLAREIMAKLRWNDRLPAAQPRSFAEPLYDPDEICGLSGLCEERLCQLDAECAQGEVCIGGACAPPRPTEVGSAAQRVAHLGVQLVQQDLEAEREGLRMTPRDDFSPVRERLETLAACELRLDDRRLGEAVLDPLCYEWVIGLQATEDYWWILLAATRLDFVLDGSHYEPEGNQTPEQRARPWGTQPEDPWQRFLELRIVQHETTPTRVTNQGVLQALADPRAFAGRPWRVGPHQWASAAAQLSHTKLGRGWGDPGEARALLERATQLDPQSPYAHHYLAVLLDGQGEPALARAANDRALACYEALYTDRDALRRSVLARILELRIELCDPQRERELALRAFSRMRPVSPDRSAKLLERCPWLAE